MLTSYPIYLLYDDNDHYCAPSSYEQLWRHQQQKKRRQAEAARRAEIYRLYQMKKEEENRRLAREEEYNRRRVAMLLKQEEEQHRHQLAMQYRLQEQERIRRKIAAFQQSQKRQMDEQKEEEGKTRTIVRSNDGRTFKISLNTPRDDMESDSDATEPTSKTWNETQYVPIKPVVDVQFLPVTNESLPQKSSLPRGSVTVMVEDASDDESDQDSINSVCRNRRPSPGQWMEPINDSYPN